MVFLFGSERDAYWRHWQWVGIQLTISTWPWIMNLFLGSLSCSLILTISLWQELFRWENRDMEKFTTCLGSDKLNSFTARSTQTARVDSHSERGKGQATARHLLSCGHQVHTHMCVRPHTHTYAPSRSPRTSPEFNILCFNSLKKAHHYKKCKYTILHWRTQDNHGAVLSHCVYVKR